MAIHKNIIEAIYFKSKIGEFIVGVYENELCLRDWRYRKMRDSIDNRIHKKLCTQYNKGGSQLIYQLIQQMSEYFNAVRRSLNNLLKHIGSEFQIRVWKELLKIPYGGRETYLGLSKRIDNKETICAIAFANGANTNSTIVPCHRISGSGGKLVGYAGGLEAKKTLKYLQRGENNSQQMSLST